VSHYANPVYKKAKQLGFEVLFRSGIVALFRRLHRNSVLALTYHDVLPVGFPRDNLILFGLTVDTTEFAWQLDYIKSHYNPISLKQLRDWLRDGAPLPPAPVLITFDDGHLNNLRYAAPLLKERGMPAVFFVLAGNLGSKCMTWVEEGYYRLLFSATKGWNMRSGESLSLATEGDRVSACTRFYVFFRALSEADQQLEMAELRRQLPVEENSQQWSERFEFLAPSDLKLLRQHGIEVGGHTLTHPVLSTLEPTTARAEIAECKAKLEEVIGSEIHAFAYPFGNPGSEFTSRDSAFVQEAGFSLAFSGIGGFIDRHTDRLCLPRVGIGRMSRAHFAVTVTGTLDAVKKFLRRQAS